MTEIDMQSANESDRRYVFVCGMPRSGTSILGRNIARMENCTGLQNTGVLEDEGGFLQDVYPTEHVCGGPGRFGFDRRSHLTEQSVLLTPANVAKLHATWHRYWNNSKKIFVEKTPANLLMTRFLQAAFPNSYFVVTKRHPIAASIAAQKWKVNVTSLDNMFEHWLHCHALFDQDKRYLNHVYELKYEDYVKDPDKYHQEIAAFIGTRVPTAPTSDTFRYVPQWRNPVGLRVPEIALESVTDTYSHNYLERWSRLLIRSPFRGYYRYLVKKYGPPFAGHGYSLIEGLDASQQERLRRVKIHEGVGEFYCMVADTLALMARIGARLIGGVKKGLRTYLPESVKAWIKRARRRVIPEMTTASLSRDHRSKGGSRALAKADR
jgi:hypothetical protein